MKKIIIVLLFCLITLSIPGCSSTNDTKYVVGICQLAKHDALDSATQGFKDALTAEFGDSVVFIEGNAAGDIPTCTTICNGFVADDVDLILANATGALQAAYGATKEIPILATSVTEYGVALNIDDFSGITHTNVSGTSDLAPLSEQANMFKELLPEVTKVAILYCSAEPNSLYQVKVISDELNKLGIETTPYSFSDSNDVYLVTSKAAEENQAIYIPTDNTAASCADIIGSVCLDKKIPAICGEEGSAKKCGIATLTIDYYKLGVLTGKMAISILKGEQDIKDMPIQYFQNPVKKYNKEICEKLNITVPQDYIAMEN